MTPNSLFEKHIAKFPLFSSVLLGKSFPQADASKIRKMYGVPKVSGTCHHPRASAVWEYNEYISPDDLACYTQYNDLPNSIVEQKSNRGTAICQYPDCICPVGSPTPKILRTGIDDIEYSIGCGEANLDVQMLSATSQGTKIMTFSYFGPGATHPQEQLNYQVGGYYDMINILTSLAENEQETAPAVVSISYDGTESPPDT